MRPSGRLIVPSFEALAPEPAVGLAPPLRRSGGQNLAHAPVHLIDPGFSAVRWYRDRPLDVTSRSPYLLLCAAFTVPLFVIVAAIAAPTPTTATSASAPTRATDLVPIRCSF